MGIQLALTPLAVAAVYVDWNIGKWLHSMAATDPVRQYWEPRLEIPGDILYFYLVWPWMLFTLGHFVFLVTLHHHNRPDSPLSRFNL